VRFALVGSVVARERRQTTHMWVFQEGETGNDYWSVFDKYG